MIDSAFHEMTDLSTGSLHYFSVLGRALCIAQHLEMNCRAIAGFLQMRGQVRQYGSSVIDTAAFQKEMLQLWNKTLGQHVTNLNQGGVFPNEVAAVLKAAVDARNEIAHSVAMDVTDRLDSELDERINHLRELVRKIASADKFVSALIHLLNEDPLPGTDFLESYEESVTAWVTEKTFDE